MEERVAYNTDFAAWYANRDQITFCIQQTNGMDEAATENFRKGVDLLQPWPFANAMADSLNCLPAMRCVPLLMKLTDNIKRNIGTAATAPQQPVIDPKMPTAPSASAAPIASAAPSALRSDRSEKTANNASTPAPPAPLPITGTLHIDQIAYLLSPELRQRAEMLKAKLDERDINSNEAKRLAMDGATNDAIRPYAKAASDAQEFVSKTYEQIDEELALYVAIEKYMRIHKAAPGSEETAFKNALLMLDEAAKPFGSLDHLLAALSPYYNKCKENGTIDRKAEQYFAVAIEAANRLNDESNNRNIDASGNRAIAPSDTQQLEEPAYDLAEYKRIWTYVSRKDVAHTEKRLKKMRTEIDAAKTAGMPNIDAMEAIYQHEAELVLAEQQKKINEEGPSLL